MEAGSGEAPVRVDGTESAGATCSEGLGTVGGVCEDERARWRDDGARVEREEHEAGREGGERGERGRRRERADGGRTAGAADCARLRSPGGVCEVGRDRHDGAGVEREEESYQRRGGREVMTTDVSEPTAGELRGRLTARCSGVRAGSMR